VQQSDSDVVTLIFQEPAPLSVTEDAQNVAHKKTHTKFGRVANLPLIAQRIWSSLT